MLTGNGENPQLYGLWTVEDYQNWLFANRSINLDFRFVDLKNTGRRATLSRCYKY